MGRLQLAKYDSKHFFLAKPLYIKITCHAAVSNVYKACKLSKLTNKR